MKIRTRLLALTAVANCSMTATGNEINALLKIDIANPSAVVISSTGAAATADSDANGAWDGILLSGLFAQASPYSGLASSSDLTASGTDRAYNRAQSSPSDLDLNLFYGGILQEHDFDTMSPAFTGSLTLDLTGRTFNPLGFGDVKEKLAGAGMGQWVLVNHRAVEGEPAKADLTAVKAVPAPAMFALVVFGLGLIRLGRR